MCSSDPIRGGLVNLLIHSHEVLKAGVNCQGYEIDVMDFIKCELHWAVHEMKNPVYAPYVMKLILEKCPLSTKITLPFTRPAPSK